MAVDVVDVADLAYRRRQELVRRAIAGTRQLWRSVDPARIGGSWASGPAAAALALIAAAQASAASSAAADVDAMLAAQGVAGDVGGQLVVSQFAGVASDGRDLASLLNLVVPIALHQIEVGLSPGDALALTGRWLDLVVNTQLTDTHRAATQVAAGAHSDVGGFTRVAHSPCCSRCAILSGRWYRYDAGFQRHPRCHCSQVPSRRDALDGHDGVLTPEKYFDSLPAALQDRVFTKAGAQAIREGADINQVVNARRDMHTATLFGRDLKVTREGVTRRGVAGSRELIRRNGGVRLMPEEIFRVSSSREEARRLLEEYGYIRRDVPPPRPPTSEPPAPPRRPGAGGGGRGRRPLVPDLLPTSTEPAELASIRDALASVIEGRHGPYLVANTRVETAFVEVGTLAWQADVTTESGTVIGQLERTYFRNGQGDLIAEHDLQRLQEGYRGRGFDSAFGRFLEDWYRESGVAAIRLIAGLDEGGFHWARRGFQWDGTPSDVIERLAAAVDRNEGTAGELAAAQQILQRLRDGSVDSLSYPSPLDVAMIGWSEGARSWLGRRVMRGSQWYGVKRL